MWGGVIKFDQQKDGTFWQGLQIVVLVIVECSHDGPQSPIVSMQKVYNIAIAERVI